MLKQILLDIAVIKCCLYFNELNIKIEIKNLMPIMLKGY